MAFCIGIRDAHVSTYDLWKMMEELAIDYQDLRVDLKVLAPIARQL